MNSDCPIDARRAHINRAGRGTKHYRVTRAPMGDGSRSVIGRDSPDLARAKQLIDELKAQGFEFVRTAPGQDGPLMGCRRSEDFVDFVYIEGFSHDCIALRQRQSPLIIPGQGLVERRITGGALTVLAEALSWQSE